MEKENEVKEEEKIIAGGMIDFDYAAAKHIIYEVIKIDDMLRQYTNSLKEVQDKLGNLRMRCDMLKRYNRL